MRRTVTIAAALALGVAGPACSAVREALDPSGAPSVPGAAGTQAAISLNGGRARISFTGDAEGTRTFDTLANASSWTAPHGPLSLIWRSERFEFLTLDGLVQEGALPTSSTLRLQIAIEVEGKVVGFGSDDGACTITMTTGQPAAVAGRFVCVRLRSTDETNAVELTGSFEARA
jgi:hypothetical protein